MEQSVAMEEAAEKKAADRGNKQLVVQTFLAQLGMLYGMTQGSLLLLFVPTQCPRREPGTTTLFTYRHSLPPGHVCTMQETVGAFLALPLSEFSCCVGVQGSVRPFSCGCGCGWGSHSAVRRECGATVLLRSCCTSQRRAARV